MINYCITGKISKRLKIKPDKPNQVSTGKLGNWYVNYLIFGRQHLVIAVSETTFLPILITAKDQANFPARLREQLGLVLTHLGVDPEMIEEELSHMNDWSFCKTSNRQVIGMMVDFARLLEWHEAYHFVKDALFSTSLYLADTPCSPLKYGRPIDEVRKLFLPNLAKIIPINRASQT